MLRVFNEQACIVPEHGHTWRELFHSVCFSIKHPLIAHYLLSAVCAKNWDNRLGPPCHVHGDDVNKNYSCVYDYGDVWATIGPSKIYIHARPDDMKYLLRELQGFILTNFLENAIEAIPVCWDGEIGERFQLPETVVEVVQNEQTLG